MSSSNRISAAITKMVKSKRGQKFNIELTDDSTLEGVTIYEAGEDFLRCHHNEDGEEGVESIIALSSVSIISRSVARRYVDVGP